MSAEMIPAEETPAAANGRSGLSEIWSRLEGVCSKLWDDDHKSAVTLQALIEEFRVEVERAERAVVSLKASLEHQRKTIEKESAARFAEEISDLKRRLDGEGARAASLEGSAAAAGERIEAIQAEKLELEKRLSSVRADMSKQRDEIKKEILASFEAQVAGLEQLTAAAKDQTAAVQAAVEEERKKNAALIGEKKDLESALVRAREDALTSESARDRSRADRMQEVLTDLRKKEEALEASWSARRLELETEYQERQSHLEKSYLDKEKSLEKSHRSLRSELDEKENDLNKLEDELLARQHENQRYRHQLEESWRKKRLELDDLKASLQREVKELVQRYKSQGD